MRHPSKVIIFFFPYCLGNDNNNNIKLAQRSKSIGIADYKLLKANGHLMFPYHSENNKKIF